MTTVQRIKQGNPPAWLRDVANAEGVSYEMFLRAMAEGIIVVPCNQKKHLRKPVGVGQGLRTKINANIGTSPDHTHVDEEMEKLRVAIHYGADAVMDLSTGGDIVSTRRTVVELSDVCVGTVPMYEAALRARDRDKSFVNMKAEDLFSVIDAHGCDGVDFITVHCGITLSVLEMLYKQGRVLDIVSRGGALIAEWMAFHQTENPLYAQFDRLLEIAARHEMTLSLGDGMRPGCLADATDRAQIGELLVLGDLTRRARAAGVQVMIEGPGHVPLNQVEENIRLQKSLCENAPFYVLGPLVTDVAPGYDHITSAIGGAVAAMAGADFLCYVTPAEHLRLPTVEDVRQGVMAARIAAHAGDIAKGIPGAMNADRAISQARKALDWDGQFRHALDPDLAEQMRRSRMPADQGVCTMCGEFCAIRSSSEATRMFKNK